MVCDQYREEMMALLDGEVEEKDRAGIESHVLICPECRCELDRFERLNRLTDGIRFSAPGDLVWEHYYSGVCRKLEAAGGWVVWSAGSLLLVATGSLMLFGFSQCALATLLGVISMTAGIGLLWLSYFCNCKH